LRSVLATDDDQDRLVLTRAGNGAAHDALLQALGGDVQWASAVVSGSRQLSHYKVNGATDGAGHHVAVVELAGCRAGWLGRCGVGGWKRGR
jgi:hypothetical protein